MTSYTWDGVLGCEQGRVNFSAARGTKTQYLLYQMIGAMKFNLIALIFTGH